MMITLTTNTVIPVEASSTSNDNCVHNRDNVYLRDYRKGGHNDYYRNRLLLWHDIRTATSVEFKKEAGREMVEL